MFHTTKSAWRRLANREIHELNLHELKFYVNVVGINGDHCFSSELSCWDSG